jgi:uncharacterized iron-regulated membrane protein
VIDLPAIVEMLGGGLDAVVIAALGWVCWWQMRKIATIQDKRVEDNKASAAAMQEVMGVLSSLENVVNGNTTEMRELRHTLDRAERRGDA